MGSVFQNSELVGFSIDTLMFKEIANIAILLVASYNKFACSTLCIDQAQRCAAVPLGNLLISAAEVA